MGLLRPRRLVSWLLLALVCGPIFLVGPLRWIDPPTTAMIQWRRRERIAQNKVPPTPRRTVVPLAAISSELQRAVIASEDDAFYLHHGFDFRAVEKAVASKVEGHRRLHGASTISQQTVKNLFLWPGRSWVRKAIEAYLTVYLEMLLDKPRILELYLNLIECGDGVFGAEQAAQTFFHKSAAKLSAEESARIAAILPSPRKHTPFSSYADGRVEHILRAMERGIPRR